MFGGHQGLLAIEVELPEHTSYELRYRRRFVEKSIETQVQDAVVSARIERSRPPLHILVSEVRQGGVVKATAKGKFLPYPDRASG